MTDAEREEMLLRRLKSEKMTVEETMDVLAQYFGPELAHIEVNEDGKRKLILSDELAERIRRVAEEYDKDFENSLPPEWPEEYEGGENGSD